MPKPAQVVPLAVAQHRSDVGRYPSVALASAEVLSMPRPKALEDLRPALQQRETHTLDEVVPDVRGEGAHGGMIQQPSDQRRTVRRTIFNDRLECGEGCRGIVTSSHTWNGRLRIGP